MKGKMKAWRLYAPQDLRLEIIDIPRPGPDEALLKVEVVTTCGTDLKLYKRGHPKVSFPTSFGHEVVGTVIEKGPALANVKVGDRVATVAMGAYAEYVLVKPPVSLSEMPLLPGDVPAEAAALSEPFACAYHGIVESNVRLGDQVAVLGCGPIGLMFVRLAKMSGATVIATDTVEGRLGAARKIEADVTVNIGLVEDPIKTVRSLTEDGAGADIVIEAVGLPAAWEQALYMIRRGGLVTFFGGCEKGTSVTFDTEFIHYQEARMQGVFHYHHPDHFLEAFNLIRQGALNPEVFVTEHAPLEELDQVLQRLLEGYEGIKIAIHPDA